MEAIISLFDTLEKDIFSAMKQLPRCVDFCSYFSSLIPENARLNLNHSHKGINIYEEKGDILVLLAFN